MPATLWSSTVRRSSVAPFSFATAGRARPSPSGGAWPGRSPSSPRMSGPKVPTVVFIGQPNGGKSTLFNALAGPKAETSNFPGTSVKHTHSRVSVDGRLLDVIDLPGTYSLCTADPAEQVALTHLFSERPDLIINVVDASTSPRGFELTLELIELGLPMVVALNMIDVAERRGLTFDAARLAGLLGVPVVPTVAAHGRGVREMLD